MKTRPIFSVNKLFLKVFGCSPSNLAEQVVITPFLHPSKFKSYFKKETVIDFSGELYQGFTGRFKNKFITFIRAGIGGQIVSDCLFFLKKARVTKIVFLGTVGGLNNLEIGDLLLVSKATSHTNPAQYILADRNYFKKISNYFGYIKKDSKFQICEGTIFSLASLFDQNKNFLKSLRKLGFSGVDLELSYVYQAAQINRIKAVGLCVVSDLPFKKPLGEVNKIERNILLNSLNFSIANILEFLAQDVK